MKRYILGIIFLVGLIGGVGERAWGQCDISGPASVCVGSSIVLTDEATAGTWSTMTTSTATVDESGNVYGVSAGTVNIHFNNGMGCFYSYPVTVNALPTISPTPRSVCAGATVTLTTSPSGGTWSSSNTSIATVGSSGSSVSLSGVSQGVDTISYTMPSGCTDTAIITVNIAPTAIIGPGGNPPTVCAGSTIALTDGITGGTWSSSSSGIASVGLNSGIVIPGALPGATTITYSTNCGSPVTAIVTVNAQPSAITGNTPLCISGGDITLHNSVNSGTWSSSNTSIATVGLNSGIITPGAIYGNTTITYSTGCGTNATASVTVNAPPAAITGNTPLCTGSSFVTLSNSIPGGTWSSANTGVASVGLNSGVVTPGAVGGTTVITYATGCGTSVNTVETVNASPAVITGNSPRCIGGGGITLSNSVNGGTWSSSNTGVASVGLNSGFLTPGELYGNATITYTTGCGTDANATVTVNAPPAAITGNTPLCTGSSSVTLSNSISGGTWSSGNNSVASVGLISGTVTPGATNGTVIITYATGCGSPATTTETVNASPAGITGNSVRCTAGPSITLHDAINGGTWSSSNNSVASVGSNSGLITPGALQGATIITYATGCGTNATAIVSVNTTPAAITGNIPMCASGGSITLGNTSNGGIWSSSSGIVSVSAATGFISALGVQGNATITYSTGCGANATAVITVNASPAAIAGNAPLCTGGTGITLSNTANGGTWISGAASIASISNTSGAVTPGGVQGNTVVTYSNGCGSGASITVTVNAPPVTITGNTPICASGVTAGGTSVTLANTSTGGIWGGGIAGTATINTISGTVMSGVTAGTATVSYSNGCGTAAAIIITVNPVPIVNAVTSLAICNDTTSTSIAFTGSPGSAAYSWAYSSSLTSIGLTHSSTGNIPAFPAANSTSSPVVAIFTVTPSANGCTGVPKNFNVTVNPTPTVSISPGNQGVCNSAHTTIENFSESVTGTSYTWVNTNSSIGIANSGSGNAIAPVIANNTTSSPINGVITVTPSAHNCPGPVSSFTITVSPSPVVTASPGNQAVCNGASTSEAFTSSVTGTNTYSWTNTNTSIGLAGSGSGDVSFTATNSSSSPISGSISVIPTANGCTGNTETFTITVNPTPSVTAVSNQTHCSNQATNAVTFSGSVTGATYTWTNSSSSIGLASSGTGNISSFTAINSGASPVNGIIAVTPSANGCPGPVSTFTITVNPLPPSPAISIHPPSNSVCINTMYQNFGTNGTSTGTYKWTATNATIYAQEDTTAAAHKNQNCLVNFTAPGAATITLTDLNTATQCASSPPATVTITVQNTDAPQEDSVINFEGSLVCLQNQRAGITYLWGYDVAATLDSGILSGNNTNQNYYFRPPPLVVPSDTLYWVITTDTSNHCAQKSYYYAPAPNKSSNNSTTNGGLGEMKVYPNPASSYIGVQFDNIENNLTLKVVDITGREVLTLPVLSTQTNIDISGLVPSVYLLECYLNGVKVANSRFVKK